MIIAAAILAFILICFLRVRLLAQYDENGFILRVCRPYRERILPADRRAAKRKKKARESAIKAGRLESLRAQLPP